MFKKFFIFYIILFPITIFCNVNVTKQTLKIKKSDSVITHNAEKMDTVQSLLPVAVNLYSGIKNMKDQEQQVNNECTLSSSEIEFINHLMKEWVKTGVVTKTNLEEILGRRPCDNNNSYEIDVQIAFNTPGMDVCYEVFKDKNKIWNGYPKASQTYYCKDGNERKNCSADKQIHVTNGYEMFSLISFRDEDLLENEITQMNKLKEKTEKCAPINVKKHIKQNKLGFAINALTNIGNATNTNTGNILQSVGSITNQGTGQMLQNLAPSLLQIMDK